MTPRSPRGTTLPENTPPFTWMLGKPPCEQQLLSLESFPRLAGDAGIRKTSQQPHPQLIFIPGSHTLQDPVMEGWPPPLTAATPHPQPQHKPIPRFPESWVSSLKRNCRNSSCKQQLQLEKKQFPGLTQVPHQNRLLFLQSDL